MLVSKILVGPPSKTIAMRRSITWRIVPSPYTAWLMRSFSEKISVFFGMITSGNDGAPSLRVYGIRMRRAFRVPVRAGDG